MQSMTNTLMGALVGAKDSKKDSVDIGIDIIIAPRSFEKMTSHTPSLTVSWY